MHVLIVDDSAQVRRSLRDVLARTFGGATFGEAASASEGLGRLESQEWDVVLLDLSLPDRSGLAALADFRRLRPRVPVLVMSMHPASQYAPAVVAAGAAGYVAKGSDPEVFVAAVRAAVFLPGGDPPPRPVDVLAREREGRHLAGALHEDVGQLLTAMKIGLRLAASSGDREEMRGRLEEVVALVDQAIGSVRRLVARLSPPLLDELGLVAAVRALVAGLQAEAAAAGTSLTLDLSAAERAPRRLDVELEGAAFQIIEEALANVLRHARARTATVRLGLQDGAVWIDVRDDGCGFDVAAKLQERGPSGLARIREWARALGGRCELRSKASGGTELKVVLPQLSAGAGEGPA